MTFRQAVAYFFREATVSLFRSWKVSLVAVLTIAMSLFMGGLFFLVSRNLSQAVERWGEELKVIVYLDGEHGGDAKEKGSGDGDEDEDGAGDRSASDSGGQISDRETRHALLKDLTAQPWIVGVEEVSPAQAMARFEETFPSLADVMANWQGDPLPASVELTLDQEWIDDPRVADWIDGLRADPGVSLVDDDREWLRQLGALIAVIRTVGLGLGLALLGAAIFTIASVVKLTAYLYLEEIAVMRLVGATEFFIRGPFYTEGFLQGVLGGGLALSALYGSSYVFFRASGTESLWLPMILGDFLPWQQQVLLVLLGASAGLIGAVLSLRRETLRAETDV